MECIVTRELNRYLDDYDRRQAYLEAVDAIADELTPYDLVAELDLKEIARFDDNLTLIMGRKATPASVDRAITELTDLFSVVAHRAAENVLADRMAKAAECEALARHERLLRRAYA